MNERKLYIIGNGFDIHHGISSRYSDFKDYVENNDQELFDTLEKYFNTDELWSDFEETLAFIDTDTITDDASDFLVSYGADDWSDANHHDYQYEVQRAIDIVTVQLKEHFTNWILQLEIPNSSNLVLDSDSKFLTFNYTVTLEVACDIDSANILYVHNKAINENSLLILGHSRTPSEQESFSKENDEDTDVRVAEGNDILDSYFQETYKDIETIIEENSDFFSDLSNVNEVTVLGHSISPVDIKYFELIKGNIDENSTWKISYYGDQQKEQNKNKVLNLGVNESQIVMITLNEI
jgi:hypothetical protein